MEKCWSWFFPLYQLAYYLSYGNSHFDEVQTFHAGEKYPVGMLCVQKLLCSGVHQNDAIPC